MCQILICIAFLYVILYTDIPLNNSKVDWHFENVAAANRHSVPISFRYDGRRFVVAG